MRFVPYNFTYEGIEEHFKVWGLLHTNTSLGGGGGGVNIGVVI